MATALWMKADVKEKRNCSSFFFCFFPFFASPSKISASSSVFDFNQKKKKKGGGASKERPLAIGCRTTAEKIFLFFFLSKKKKKESTSKERKTGNKNIWKKKKMAALSERSERGHWSATVANWKRAIHSIIYHTHGESIRVRIQRPISWWRRRDRTSRIPSATNRRRRINSNHYGRHWSRQSSQSSQS